MIFFATIVGSFCTEPATVEVSTPAAATENEQQKRSIVSDCDGPIVSGGVIGGLHSDLGVHSDLAIGLHGHGYASGFSSGYLGSGGIIGGVSSVGSYGSLGHLGGAVVASPSLVSAGYAPHAPVLASSVYSSPVVSHAPVYAAPAVCFTSFFVSLKIEIKCRNWGD